MILGEIIFSNSRWAWLLAPFLAAVLLLVWWSYPRAAGPWKWWCVGFKSLGFLALGLCLLEPLWSGQRARPGANVLAVVADNSRGLQVRDRGASRSRGEMLQALLDPAQHDWHRTLGENFELRRYFFDTRLHPTADFSEVKLDGSASGIGAALDSLAERLKGRPVAGIVLFTDGNATDLPGAAEFKGLPPVYPVVLGKEDAIQDIAVKQVRTTQTDFEDAPVTIQAEVETVGYGGHSILAKLIDASGKTVLEQSLEARRDQDLLVFRFQLKPERPGLSFYRLEVRARDELLSDAETQTNRAHREATLENNQRVVTVDRGRGPYRILYVAGRPNWEYKFLNRALQEDSQLELVALIRVAKREPRFTFMGRAGESSNPLFRGFGNQSAEEIERYDQPVLVRLNTKDAQELQGGFPAREEDLYGYHAVVVDDVEAGFFTPDQAALLQRFVSERGGGFLMLGGMESFHLGKYERTPIGDMLPVYLDRPEATPAGAAMRLDLTREGWLQPWARLRDNELEEKQRLSEMVPFQVFNRAREVKPGANVIATATDSDGRTFPALAVQRFGQGRTAALMVGDLWRWGLREPEARRDMDKSWRQLIRWLVSDVPNRVELTVSPQPREAAGAVKLQVRVRDEKWQPLDDAQVRLEIQPALAAAGADTNAVRLQPEPSNSEPGVYEAVCVPRWPGGYQATAWVTNTLGVPVGQGAAGWSAEPDLEEFRSLKPNVALMEKLARATGGQVVSPQDFDSFAAALPARQAPVMENWSFPLWHTPLFFAFALACFVSEWGLRRWKGLP